MVRESEQSETLNCPTNIPIVVDTRVRAHDPSGEFKSTSPSYLLMLDLLPHEFGMSGELERVGVTLGELSISTLYISLLIAYV